MALPEPIAVRSALLKPGSFRFSNLVDSWPAGVTFPGLPDGDRKAEELVRMVRAMVSET
jgi:hypothetical protein